MRKCRRRHRRSDDRGRGPRLGDQTMKQLGVGLAAAILIDAAIVRAVPLPAAMKQLGGCSESASETFLAHDSDLPRCINGAERVE